MTRWLSSSQWLRLSVAVFAGAMLGGSLAPTAASASSDPKFSWTGGSISGDLDVASGIVTTIGGTAVKSLTSPSTAPTALTLHGTTALKGSGDVQLNGTTTLNNLGTPPTPSPTPPRPLEPSTRNS